MWPTSQSNGSSRAFPGAKDTAKCCHAFSSDSSTVKSRRNHSSLCLSFALSVAFFAGPSLGAEPDSNRRVLVPQAPPVISVNSVAVSPDGSLIATGAEGVRLYDARTGALLRAIGGGWDENGAGGREGAFAPDGRALAGAGSFRDQLGGTVDVRTGPR